jgi:hypothetical protein
MANPYLQTVMRDATEKARMSLARLKNSRGGKFKISERQYVEEAEATWLFAEFSAAERIMRAIESDDDLDNKDNIRAALHIYILESYEVLKKKFNLRRSVTLEDLIDGKHSTETILRSRDEHN